MRSLTTLLLLLLPATTLASPTPSLEVGINSCKYDCFCHTDQSSLCCADVGGTTDESGRCTKMSLGIAQSFVQCCEATYSCRQGMGCPELEGGGGDGGMGEVDLR
ncbi:hypothetical protein QBC41DRAFT_300283 [Cercophora samala]|uniref:Uncharacterized protein n=1 Tax=Cercophora samala TaxID=330535 RepID=A0AA40DF08_9PEZI|nr:hypothetical protein QBC41DRAFT_300283 [Cercophora samala]